MSCSQLVSANNASMVPQRRATAAGDRLLNRGRGLNALPAKDSRERKIGSSPMTSLPTDWQRRCRGRARRPWRYDLRGPAICVKPLASATCGIRDDAAADRTSKLLPPKLLAVGGNSLMVWLSRQRCSDASVRLLLGQSSLLSVGDGASVGGADAALPRPLLAAFNSAVVAP